MIGRGLFRLWLVISLFWVAFPAIMVPNSGYFAQSETDDVLVGFVLIPPLVLLAIGAGLCWAAAGFLGER